MSTMHDLPSYMQALRASFEAERARGRSVTLQYVFTGAVEGACHADIVDGALTVAEGRCASPTATITADFDLWLRVVAYHLDPLLAYQEGLYSIDGDIETLIEADSWFRR
ncbi:MAG TPA: SCP2 sterol-binding domain-containing protein [Ktedonobacterales bacterium]